MDINYLLNSGFLIRDEKILLVFDDYEDPAGIVDAAYDKGDFDRLYIFATHAHFDHFSTRIRAYAEKVTRRKQYLLFHVINYKGKHTAQVVKHILALVLVKVQKRFRIGVGLELKPLFKQLRP